MSGIESATDCAAAVRISFVIVSAHGSSLVAWGEWLHSANTFPESVEMLPEHRRADTWNKSVPCHKLSELEREF